jgi:tetratricopeptide (TPR) repeat protein
VVFFFFFLFNDKKKKKKKKKKDGRQFCFTCCRDLVNVPESETPFGCIVGGGCGARCCSRECFERFVREYAGTSHKAPCALLRKSLGAVGDKSLSKEAKNNVAMSLRNALTNSDAYHNCFLQALLCADLFADSEMIGTYLGVAAHASNDLKLPRIALELSRKAVKLVNSSSLFAAACHSLAGLVLSGQNKFGAALEHYEQALRAMKALNGDKHTDVAACHNSIGVVLVALNKPADAMEQFDLALAIRRAATGDEENANIATSYTNIGLALAKQGKFAEAVQRHEQALAIFTRVHNGEDHAEVADCLANWASTLAIQAGDKLPDAVATYERALAIQQRTRGGENFTEVGRLLGKIAAVQVQQDKLSDALATLNRALAIFRAVAKSDDGFDVTLTKTQIADIEKQQKK